MYRGLILVQVFNKRGYAALILEFMLFVGSLVLNGYAHTGVKEGKFPQPLRKDIKAEICCFKDFFIRLELDSGAVLLRLADNLKLFNSLAPLVPLLINLAASFNLHLKPL